MKTQIITATVKLTGNQCLGTNYPGIYGFCESVEWSIRGLLKDQEQCLLPVDVQVTNGESFTPLTDTDWVTEYVYDTYLDQWEENKDDLNLDFCLVDSDAYYEYMSGWTSRDRELEELNMSWFFPQTCIWCGQISDCATYCSRDCFDQHGRNNELNYLIAKECVERGITIDELVKFINKQ